LNELRTEIWRGAKRLYFQRGQRRHQGSVSGPAKRQQPRQAILVRREQRRLGRILAQAEHARYLAVGAHLADEGESDVAISHCIDLQLRDAVRVVSRVAVADVDIKVILSDGDFSSRRCGEVYRWESRAEGADVLRGREGHAACDVVCDLEEDDLAEHLTHEEVMRRRGRTDGEEGAVARPAAGQRHADLIDKVEAVIDGVDDKDAVGAEVVDDEEATLRLQQRLMRVRLVLSGGVRAQLALGDKLLDQR